ncbi:hypothetical protein [Cohnella sp. GCM10027633]|uniref:hypothetical protein n=1 Tax=unclassified Cohnella TaxID=2636738 RepID=UPI0036439FEA
MSKRATAWLGGIAILLGIALIVIAASLFYSPREEEEPANAPASASPSAIASPSPAPKGEPAVERLPGLTIKIVDAAQRGWQLQFDSEQATEVVATAETKQAVVHALLRYGGDEGYGSTMIGIDAVVVRPDEKSVRSYPLYEVSNARMIGAVPFYFIDDRRLLFVKQSEMEGVATFDLATLDVGNGEVAMVTKAFWELDMKDQSSGDDFLIGSHYAKANGEGAGSIMLASHQGRVWTIDVGSGAVHALQTAYPAYGDPGSTPPRELVYPSPDLSRFVYQEKYKSNFKVVDTDTGVSLSSFGFQEDTILMEPGIDWNPDGSFFYLEFGARERAVGIQFDNGYRLYAEAVTFYDRDGIAYRTIEPPAGSKLRMNVYGWADDGRVWLEYYRATPQETGDPTKTDVTYKLLDIETGELTDYKTTNDPGELAQPEIVRRNLFYGYSYPVPFLLANREKKLIWQPQPEAAPIYDGDALYVQLRSEETSDVFAWQTGDRSWQLVDGDSGEARNGEMIFATPNVYEGKWLIYTRRYEHRIDYVPIVKEAVAGATRLPAIPASFAEQQGTSEWWTNGGEHVKIGDDRALRARGVTRFGTIELRAEPGEASMRDGGASDFHGDYRMTFATKGGKRLELPKLEGVTLMLEGSIGSMASYEMDGFDIVLFRPRDYRFSQGYDGGIRETLAYAVTEKGEAFPLTFVYEMAGAGRQESAILPIDVNIPVARDGEELVVRTIASGSRELRLSPNLAERTLTVVSVTDLSDEYNRLLGITTRYTELIEQELGLTEGVDAGAVVDAERLKGLFSRQALRNPGLKRMQADFAKAKADGNPSRAFTWTPIDSRYVSPDTIRFTFTLNLWYAIGLAAHLEVALKLDGDEWEIHDLGTLETEKLDGVAGYNGLLVKDTLEL